MKRYFSAFTCPDVGDETVELQGAPRIFFCALHSPRTFEGEPMRLTARTPRPAWVEGVADRGADHASLSYGESRRAMALVAPYSRHGFTVQFLRKARRTEVRANQMLDEVRRELTFYLLDVVGPDSWPFVQYHCETLANRLSSVHWTWHPKTESRRVQSIG